MSSDRIIYAMATLDHVHDLGKKMIQLFRHPIWTLAFCPYALNSMPSGDKNIMGEVRVTFFFIDRPISNDELAWEYTKRNLEPAPHAVAMVNHANPDFCKRYPNGSQWKGPEGDWCYVYFAKSTVCENNSANFGDHRISEIWDEPGWYGGLEKD